MIIDYCKHRLLPDKVCRSLETPCRSLETPCRSFFVFFLRQTLIVLCRPLVILPCECQQIKCTAYGSSYFLTVLQDLSLRTVGLCVEVVFQYRLHCTSTTTMAPLGGLYIQVPLCASTHMYCMYNMYVLGSPVH